MAEEEWKAKGNAAVAAGDFDEAIRCYSEAIKIAPSNHVLFSNRSAAFASKGDFASALDDAERTVGINAGWAKGYSRLGAALHGLSRFAEAADAYRKGLALDPSNEQMKQGVVTAEQALTNQVARDEDGRPDTSEVPDELKEIASVLSTPHIWTMLMLNEKTKDFLHEQDFADIIRSVQRHPGALQKHLKDPRMLTVLTEILGVKVMTPEEAARQAEERRRREDEMEAARKRAEEERKRKEEEERRAKEEAALTPEQRAEREVKARADVDKDRGNEHYKRKEFDEAISCYSRAIDTYPKEPSYYSNRAAVHLERGDLDACIADCDRAVEVVRETRGDLKMVARAWTRKATCLAKRGDLDAAIDLYQRALLEHRNPDTLKKLQEAEKEKRRRMEEAYIDLDKCAEEKALGNQAFQECRFPDAVRHYSEAIKRGPPEANAECYKLFSNRAASYTKLGAWADALKDANRCIELKPDFSKGYLRKAQVQFFTKDYDGALETYQEGLRHEPESQELSEGAQQCMEQIHRVNAGLLGEEELRMRQERAMQDPEVQRILLDPIMSQVLKELKENPGSASQHLKSPEIFTKLMKLHRAGILRLG